MRIPKPILERRRAVRVPENLVFQIGHEEYDLLATTLNISASGALCVVDRDIPLMTKVRISVGIPPNKTLRLIGVVVRKEKNDATGRTLIAIFFSEVSSRNQVLLKAFIDSRLKP
ncbi:MAG: PilZ domain-containing protein [Candidatus Omnitrophica bacterium]|nr:PilZ domain-containing protein [Candidatus Omnitrophota bacterium]